MPLLIRLGDTSDHGGEVINAASKTTYEGKLVARKTNDLDCPLHGINPIVEGSSKQIVEGQPVARQGDHTACGAALISSCTRSFDE